MIENEENEGIKWERSDENNKKTKGVILPITIRMICDNGTVEGDGELWDYFSWDERRVLQEMGIISGMGILHPRYGRPFWKWDQIDKGNGYSCRCFCKDHEDPLNWIY